MKLSSFFVGTWFILTGLKNLVDLHFLYDNWVMAGLAIIAGVLTIIRQ